MEATETGSLKSLLGRMDSFRSSVREAAVREARALPPEPLAELILLESRSYRRSQVRSGFLVLALLLSYGLVSLLHKSVWAIVAVTLYIITWVFYVGMLLFVPRRAHRGVATLLDRIDDPRLLDVVLSMATGDPNESDVRKSGRAALKRLLPKLRADQKEGLPPQFSHRLLSLLQSPYEDVGLTLALLKALEQIGDESALSAVERLTNEPGATANMKRVREAARDCLPFLHEHIRQTQQAQTLLRASDSTANAAPETLLRPASATGIETPREELLRPAESAAPPIQKVLP